MRRIAAALLIVVALSGNVEASAPGALAYPLPYRVFVPHFYASATTSHGAGMTWNWTCEDVAMLGLDWFHAWGNDPPELCGQPDAYADLFRPYYPLESTRVQMGDIVQGPNEPDRPDQDTMTPAEAAQLWRWLEDIYPGKTLVSPAVSHGGLNWLWAWIDAYHAQYGPFRKLDAVALHLYSTGQPDDLQVYMQAARDGLLARGIDAPLWLTEFCRTNGTTQEKIDWMYSALDWMAGTPWIERWAWYGTRPTDTSQCSLIDSAGNLTPIGVAYRAWPALH